MWSVLKPPALLTICKTEHQTVACKEFNTHTHRVLPQAGLWSVLSNSCPIKCVQDLEALCNASAESPAGWHPEYCNHSPLTPLGIVFVSIIQTEIDHSEFPLTPCIKQHFSSFLRHINNTTALFSTLPHSLCLNPILFHFICVCLQHFLPSLLFSVTLFVSLSIRLFLSLSPVGLLQHLSIDPLKLSLVQVNWQELWFWAIVQLRRCPGGTSTCGALAQVAAETFH